MDTKCSSAVADQSLLSNLSAKMDASDEKVVQDAVAALQRNDPALKELRLCEIPFLIPPLSILSIP
jgi:hypothetical protein